MKKISILFIILLFFLCGCEYISTDEQNNSQSDKMDFDDIKIDYSLSESNYSLGVMNYATFTFYVTNNKTISISNLIIYYEIKDIKKEIIKKSEKIELIGYEGLESGKTKKIYYNTLSGFDENDDAYSVEKISIEKYSWIETEIASRNIEIRNTLSDFSVSYGNIFYSKFDFSITNNYSAAINNVYIYYEILNNEGIIEKSDIILLIGSEGLKANETKKIYYDTKSGYDKRKNTYSIKILSINIYK